MLAELKKSAPFSSMRYQGHMCWDQTLPGMVGYVAAMLYNQNNVALEASPITTVLEVEASRDLCRMLGYRQTTPQAWGHLTCGGSTANIDMLQLGKIICMGKDGDRRRENGDCQGKKIQQQNLRAEATQFGRGKTEE